MRFIVRLLPHERERPSAVGVVRTVAGPLGVDPRNPKWTSYGALELDLFAPSRGDVELLLAALGPLMEVEFLRDLSEPPPPRTEEETLAEARELFNAERYWECHEVLEGVWRTKAGAERRLLQGLILVCAAYVHHQKGEEQVALGVLRRAAEALEHQPQRYGPFEVGALREASMAMLRQRSLSVFRI